MQNMVSSQSEPDEFFLCFFCNHPCRGNAEFIEHSENHLERFERCPLCALSGYDYLLKHSLHLVDHILELHMRNAKDQIVCPCCTENFGTMRDRNNLYRGFAHLLYNCQARNACMLCLGVCANEVGELVDSHDVHCETEHAEIYNRVICSKCLRGFASVFSYRAHDCSERVYRCACNAMRLFVSKRAIGVHCSRLRDGQPHVHRCVQPVSSRTRSAILPVDFRKQLEAARFRVVAARRNHLPTRVELMQFLTKYDYLPVYAHEFNEENTLRILDSAGIASFASPAIADAVSSTTPERSATAAARRNAATSASIAAQSTSEKQTSSAKLEAAAAAAGAQKRRRQAAQDRDENLRKLTVEPAKWIRSNVWSHIGADASAEMCEVAEVIEDLVLSTAEHATSMANGR